MVSARYPIPPPRPGSAPPARRRRRRALASFSKISPRIITAGSPPHSADFLEKGEWLVGVDVGDFGDASRCFRLGGRVRATRRRRLPRGLRRVGALIIPSPRSPRGANQPPARLTAVVLLRRPSVLLVSRWISSVHVRAAHREREPGSTFRRAGQDVHR